MVLAAYAMRNEDTQGRRFPEPPHPYRSEFQRDRDRIIHTKAFRRLEKKTQVFAPDYSDHFRNRLTHTLEVSQISRTVAEALQLNADLCEVLALSHDIGHPPFSHEGEKALHQVMQKFGSGFDHNLHALRIVEDFESKYAAFRGLNLTFEVREGIIKHSRDYKRGESTYVDISAYRPGQLPPLESQLIDLADEIAYNAADLDDGYHSGLLTLDQCREVTIFRVLHRQVVVEFPNAQEKIQVSEVIRRFIDRAVTNLIETTARVLQERAISSVDGVRNCERRLVGFNDEFYRQNLELKEFLRLFLYDHVILKKARDDVTRKIEDFCSFFMDRPDRLPASHTARIDELGLERVVCDYVAGMTDSFARSRHAEIFGT